MSSVGQIERKTPARVVLLFQNQLGYAYLGNQSDADNRNIDLHRLTAWLNGRRAGADAANTGASATALSGIPGGA